MHVSLNNTFGDIINYLLNFCYIHLDVLATQKGDIAHIMCQAISQPDGGLVAVLEILRREDEEAFHEEDEEIAYSYLVWGGIALHYAHLFLNMNKQRKLNDFLLAVVK